MHARTNGDESSSANGSIGEGLRLALALHLFAPHVIVIVYVSLTPWSHAGLGQTLGSFFYALGWTQLIYVVPALLVLHVKRRRATFRGLLLVACVGFVITTACAPQVVPRIRELLLST